MNLPRDRSTLVMTLMRTMDGWMDDLAVEKEANGKKKEERKNKKEENKVHQSILGVLVPSPAPVLDLHCLALHAPAWI